MGLMRLGITTSLVLIGLVGLITLAVGCGDYGPKLGGNEDTVPQASIEDVLKEHTTALMALHGVVGTAQGECEGQPCIKVYVVKATPDLLKQIPSEIGGYTVDVQETGEFRKFEGR